MRNLPAVSLVAALAVPAQEQPPTPAQQFEALRRESEGVVGSGRPLTDAERLQFIGEAYRHRNAIALRFVDPGNAGAGPIATAWCFPCLPTFYLIDHRGVIRGKWAGAPGAGVLDEAVDKLVRAAEHVNR